MNLTDVIHYFIKNLIYENGVNNYDNMINNEWNELNCSISYSIHVQDKPSFLII